MRKLSLLAASFLVAGMLSSCKTNSFVNDPLKEKEKPAEVVEEKKEEGAEAEEKKVELTQEQPAPAPALLPPVLVPTEEPKAQEPIVIEEKKGEAKVFNVTAKRFEFSPSVITVNEGDEVTLNMTSEDTEHGFNLPDFGVNLTVKPGETGTATFKADKKGVFIFRCSVFCGEGHGEMQGTFEVK